MPRLQNKSPLIGIRNSAGFCSVLRKCLIGILTWRRVPPDTIKSVTETTHFVKLVFQRDMDMPYYNEIKELDEQFEVTLDELDSSKRLRRRSLLWSIPLGLFVMMCASGSKSIVVDIVCLIGGACVIAGGIYLRKRATKQCDELTAKRDEILTSIAHYV